MEQVPPSGQGGCRPGVAGPFLRNLDWWGNLGADFYFHNLWTFISAIFYGPYFCHIYWFKFIGFFSNLLDFISNTIITFFIFLYLLCLFGNLRQPGRFDLHGNDQWTYCTQYWRTEMVLRRIYDTMVLTLQNRYVLYAGNCGNKNKSQKTALHFKQ